MKKIDYNERANIYDLEVTKADNIIIFLNEISKKLNVKRVINCPCASGIYISDFANIFEYSYFADINNKMLEEINKKIIKYKFSNIEPINLNINELDILNGKSDCIVMLNQGLQYIEIENFKNLLDKINTNYIVIDLFDFTKKGKLTYFNSCEDENKYYLTRYFKVNNNNIKRYNKYKIINNKICFKYKYYINNKEEYTTEFELYNYKYKDVNNIINQSKYEIYNVYGDYDFENYSEEGGHYILVLRRCES